MCCLGFLLYSVPSCLCGGLVDLASPPSIAHHPHTQLQTPMTHLLAKSYPSFGFIHDEGFSSYGMRFFGPVLTDHGSINLEGLQPSFRRLRQLILSAMPCEVSGLFSKVTTTKQGAAPPAKSCCFLVPQVAPVCTSFDRSM